MQKLGGSSTKIDGGAAMTRKKDPAVEKQIKPEKKPAEPTVLPKTKIKGRPTSPLAPLKRSGADRGNNLLDLIPL
ncbi:hypothetical protein U9M48_005188 [Paspalum notatum var. saurae]|uniref:Uncharacterized protein n=1 Tax=Paspalum notatum var. saurae TaxID=547442 RepID=A0AAQ3PWZ5_PASNO